MFPTIQECQRLHLSREPYTEYITSDIIIIGGWFGDTVSILITHEGGFLILSTHIKRSGQTGLLFLPSTVVYEEKTKTAICKPEKKKILQKLDLLVPCS